VCFGAEFFKVGKFMPGMEVGVNKNAWEDRDCEIDKHDSEVWDR